jgi:hypothetical protein
MKSLLLLNTMFCACVLMQKGSVIRKLRVLCKRIFDKTLQVRFVGEASPTNCVFLEQLLKELDWADEESLELLYARDIGAMPEELGKKQRARAEARSRLATNLCGSQFNGNKISEMVHVCRYGCHVSSHEAKKQIWEDFALLAFGTRVQVPALNRWTKLYRPLAFWHVVTCLGVLPEGIRLMSTSQSVPGVLDLEEFVGMEGEQTYLQTHHARMKKAASWLTADTTSTIQGTGLLRVQIQMSRSARS